MISIIKLELSKDIIAETSRIQNKENEILDFERQKKNKKRTREDLNNQLMELQETIMCNECDLTELENKIQKTNQSIENKRQLNQFKRNLISNTTILFN